MTRLANIFARLREQSGVWFSLVLIIIPLSFLFIVALGGVSHNSKWQISRVDITGANTVSSDEVRALAVEKLLGSYFFVYARDNSYLFPKKEIEQSILGTFPRIASVFVEREDDHTIIISVSERKPYALWCGIDAGRRGVSVELADCWFIDDAGFVFDRAPVFSEGVYLEVYAKLEEKKAEEPLRATLPHERFVAANTFVKLLQKEIGESLRISLKPEGETEIILRDSAKHPFLSGATIRFKDEEMPSVLVKNLLLAVPVQFPGNVALKKKLLYVDMRFGNKIFFGFEQ